MSLTITMGEGNTPLIPSSHAATLFFKLESCNPSGSYKDRFIAAELADVLARGSRSCVATSSGNTGSSLAAYCARYGLPCLILVNQDAPEGKLAQMRAHGAIVMRIPQFVTSPLVTEAVFSQLREFAETSGAALVVSAFRYCPVGMRGVQGISHEIAARLPDVDHVFVPLGGGGLYSAVVQGFEETPRMPRIHAVQPEGCPTVLDAFANSREVVWAVESMTRISGLSVPFDIDASLALRLARKHHGMVLGVSDAEVFEAQRLLLRTEGVYAEPAGATAFAGYRKALASAAIDPAERAVCLVTGSGFKDTLSIQEASSGLESPTVSYTNVLSELHRLVDTR
jgi:threonine synthase